MIENLRKSEIRQSSEYQDGVRVEMLIKRLNHIASTLENDIFATREIAEEAKQVLDERILQDINELSSGFIDVRISGTDVFVPLMRVGPYRLTPEEDGDVDMDKSSHDQPGVGVIVGYDSKMGIRNLLPGESLEGSLYNLQVMVNELDDNAGYALGVRALIQFPEVTNITIDTPGIDDQSLIQVAIKSFALGKIGEDVTLRSTYVQEVEDDALLQDEIKRKGIHKTGFGKKIKKMDSLLYHETPTSWTDLTRMRLWRELATEAYKLAEISPLHVKLGQAALLRQMGQMRGLSVVYETKIADSLVLEEEVEGILVDVVLPESKDDTLKPSLAIKGIGGDGLQSRDGPVHLIGFKDIKALRM